MAGNTLVMKFNSQDEVEEVRNADKRIVLMRDVTVPGGAEARLVAWTAFEPRLNATLTLSDTYYVYATTVDPEAAGEDEAADEGEAGDRQSPIVFMLSPRKAIPGVSYSFEYGDFTITKPGNGISKQSIKIFNDFRQKAWLAVGLAVPLSANEFTVPRPPMTSDTPDCAPIVATKLSFRDAVTFTPGSTVKVALSKDVAAGEVLEAPPDGALSLTFDDSTDTHTATYDPKSGAFKLANGKVAKSGTGSGGSGATAKSGGGGKSGGPGKARVDDPEDGGDAAQSTEAEEASYGG